MADDTQSSTGNIPAAIDAVTGLVKAVPVYQDAVQPVAIEIGKTLQTVGKTVNLCLAPLNAMIWGFDRIKVFINDKVSKKLENVAPENIISPAPNIAVPVIEALRYTGEDAELSDMFANLLASSMNSETKNEAHPSYVEIIKQLTSDEAKIIRLFIKQRDFPIVDIIRTNGPSQKYTGEITVFSNFNKLAFLAKCDFPEKSHIYVINLCRLGLASIPNGTSLVIPDVYDDLEKHPFVLKYLSSAIPDSEDKFETVRKVFRVTDFGIHFAKVCSDRSTALPTA